MSAAALAFEGVCVELGGRRVLDDVSLAARPGEVLTLAGPNGAGKTTLFRVATRIVRPSTGRVTVFGTPLEALSQRALARDLAVVPQDASLAFPFRAAELVLMGRAPHAGGFGLESAADVERARAALARLAIEHLADRSVLELSGGERQLVLLARALVQEARVLLLDEPTAHLDLRHRVAVLERVGELAAEGRAVLVVSHDLGLAARTSDRVALLRGGRIVAAGAPAQVLTAAALRDVFGVEAEILRASDGALAVVPRAAARAERAR